VTAHFPGQFPYLFGNGMLIFGQQFFHSILLKEIVSKRFKSNASYGPFLDKTFGSAEHVDPAVRPGTGYIVLNKHAFAIPGFDQGGVHIPSFIVTFCIFRIGSEFLFGIFCHSKLVAGQGHQVFHFIPPVNIQNVADGAKAMGGVEVCISLFVVLQAPHIPVSFLVKTVFP